MRIVAANTAIPAIATEIETVVLSKAQFDYLATASRDVNPDMPVAFGGAHVIRTLLERIEEAGIDLRDAKSEEDVSRLAATGLRWNNRRSR